MYKKLFLPIQSTFYLEKSFSKVRKHVFPSPCRTSPFFLSCLASQEQRLSLFFEKIGQDLLYIKIKPIFGGKLKKLLYKPYNRKTLL